MRALIIEDEAIIGQLLKSKIGKIAKDIEVIDMLPSLRAALKWFESNPPPDLLFMDIQLSDGVSFDLFEHVQLSCPVVFTTAYDEYAIRAFKVNGVDYLLKPIEDIELEKAIAKCRSVIARNAGVPADMGELMKQLLNPGSIAAAYKQRFLVNMRNQWKPVLTQDVACFTKEVLNYLYLFNGERFLVDFNTLDEIEELLDPQVFYRANRQYIININAIAAVKPMENAKMLIKLKEPNHKFVIDLSRDKTPVFKKWLAS
ncbi:LytTR family DNA-binding domain-containing protein [Paraflavitalea sp. CAU 1676]|uniref:LytR/AlgR family response regulator transcription factor n=1 Tax=Paraflavitalea sp. CAU 1676 TaxID=3032598 RepID=UPI0023DCDB37|nr:LytTR family DNA-binding domain-containing protein [Paraflavitalea sp. CAU 1676]MDF2190359.1 LytTR family DNA-binding domain-containing protein [Paraflavitalea sp. CAU 1676]